MDNDIFIILDERYEKLYSVTLDNELFHPRTVRNFIDALSNVSDNESQLWIFKQLNDYFEEAEKHLYTMTIKISSSLWRKYLRRIGDYYANNNDFTWRPSSLVLLTILVPIFFIVKLIFFTWTDSIIFVFLCYLSTVIYLRYRTKANKSFAMFH